LQKSLAIGYVRPEYAAVGTELEMEILGLRRRATVLIESPFDPDNKKLKA
jgi:dimethylglycine dehydrogenase